MTFIKPTFPDAHVVYNEKQEKKSLLLSFAIKPLNTT